MIVLDATVVNVALPSIQKDLHFSTSSLAWVINAYLITFGGLLLLAGRVGDLVGPKKVFVTGVGLFTVASIFCGLADTQVELVAARFVQGAGRRSSPPPSSHPGHHLHRAPGEGAGHGRLRLRGLGRWRHRPAGRRRTDPALSWHWIFFINVPIGIATLVVGSFLITSGPGEGSATVWTCSGGPGHRLGDAPGLCHRRGQHRRLAHRAHIGAGAVALLLMGLFVWLESRIGQPDGSSAYVLVPQHHRGHGGAIPLPDRDVRQLLRRRPLLPAHPRVQPGRHRPRLSADEPAHRPCSRCSSPPE